MSYWATQLPAFPLPCPCLMHPDVSRFLAAAVALREAYAKGHEALHHIIYTALEDLIFSPCHPHRPNDPYPKRLRYTLAHNCQTALEAWGHHSRLHFLHQCHQEMEEAFSQLVVPGAQDALRPYWQDSTRYFCKVQHLTAWIVWSTIW